MNFLLENGQLLTLDARDFVAAGGEGRVYAVRDLAYKIYDDPARALNAAKLSELSALDDPRCVRPLELVRDPADGSPRGYAMRFVRGAIPMAALGATTQRRPASGRSTA